LASVNRICKDHNLQGVHGPILELIDCEEKFFTAVEVTAANSLFHVVVENDDISTKIIRFLTQEKGGRVTFMPLNRVRAPHVTYPQTSDVVSLLKKLDYSQHYASAFGQVFGRTVICRDLNVASRVARIDGLDCITLEGDQVNKKGGMTGGFYDSHRSKLKFMNIIKQNKISIYNKTTELEQNGQSLKELDQKITILVSEQQKLDAQRGHTKSELEQIKLDITNAYKQHKSLSTAFDKKEKLLSSAHNQADQLRAGIAMKKAEMGTDLIDQLTTEERDLLSLLNPEITELKRKLINCKTDRMEIETRKEELETNLTANLVRREQELEVAISSVDSDQLYHDIEKRKMELKESNYSINELTLQVESTSSFYVKTVFLFFNNISLFWF